jgi:hypothetical protein
MSVDISDVFAYESRLAPRAARGVLQNQPLGVAKDLVNAAVPEREARFGPATFCDGGDRLYVFVSPHSVKSTAQRSAKLRSTTPFPDLAADPAPLGSRSLTGRLEFRVLQRAPLRIINQRYLRHTTVFPNTAIAGEVVFRHDRKAASIEATVLIAGNHFTFTFPPAANVPAPLTAPVDLLISPPRRRPQLSQALPLGLLRPRRLPLRSGLRPSLVAPQRLRTPTSPAALCSPLPGYRSVLPMEPGIVTGTSPAQ